MKSRLSLPRFLACAGLCLGLHIALYAAAPDPAAAEAAPPACCAVAIEPTCCGTSPSPAISDESLREKWGIEVAGLRTSARGAIIDFRYKVLDADKAATLAAEGSKAKLIDEATGRELFVPNMPKVGRLRQTAEQLKEGRVYFALFSNPGRVVKAGSKVTVVIGDFRAEHLTVE